MGSTSKPNQPVKWHQGWVTVGGKKHYFRSLWEVDYACYLNILRKYKRIKEWEYEPQTFWFEKIKRGTRSYLPDFRITDQDGSQYFVEVKGYYDKKNLTKLRRMKKYYPEVKLLMVNREQIEEIRMKFGSLLKQQINNA
jgi:hypothetical protein